MLSCLLTNGNGVNLVSEPGNYLSCNVISKNRDLHVARVLVYFLHKTFTLHETVYGHESEKIKQILTKVALKGINNEVKSKLNKSRVIDKNEKACVHTRHIVCLLYYFYCYIIIVLTYLLLNMNEWIAFKNIFIGFSFFPSLSFTLLCNPGRGKKPCYTLIH